MSNFYEEGEDIVFEIQNDICNFFYNLSTAWCSPNAVEFYKEYALSLHRACIDISTAFWNTLVAAYRSKFDIDIGTNSYDSYYNNGDWPEITELKNSYEGIVGMNKYAVKMIRDEFEKNIKNSMVKPDAIPCDIFFFDENNEMASAYANEINKIKSKFTDIFNELVSSINAYIENENQTLELAKQQATDALSNRNA